MRQRPLLAVSALLLVSSPAAAHEACVLAEQTVCITGGLPGPSQCTVLAPNECRIALPVNQVRSDTVELVEVRLFRMPRRHPAEGAYGTVLNGAQARELVAAVLDVPTEQVQPSGVLYTLGVRVPLPRDAPGNDAKPPEPPRAEPASLQEPPESKGKGKGKPKDPSARPRPKSPRGKPMKLPKGPMAPSEGFALAALSLPSRMGLALTEDALDVRLEGYPAGDEPWPILTFAPETTALYLGGGEDGRLGLTVTSRRLPLDALQDLGGNRRGLVFVP